MIGERKQEGRVSDLIVKRFCSFSKCRTNKSIKITHVSLKFLVLSEAAMNRAGQQSKKPVTTSGSGTPSSDTLKKPTNATNVATGSSEESEDTTNNPTNSSSNITSTNSNTKEETDVYEFNALKESSGPGSSTSGDDKPESSKGSNDKSSDDKNGQDTDSSTTTTPSNSNTGPGPKRPFTEVEGADDQTGTNQNESDEIKRKKRKEGETGGSNKDTSSTSGKSGSNVRTPIRQEKGSKIPGPASKTMNIGTKASTASDNKKSPCPSPKPTTTTKSADSDGEQDDGNNNPSGTSDGPPKVPPLKIVIPQQSNSGDAGESGNLRNGKNASTRNHPALPYVVASSNR